MLDAVIDYLQAPLGIQRQGINPDTDEETRPASGRKPFPAPSRLDPFVRSFILPSASQVTISIRFLTYWTLKVNVGVSDAILQCTLTAVEHCLLGWYRCRWFGRSTGDSLTKSENRQRGQSVPEPVIEWWLSQIKLTKTRWCALQKLADPTVRWNKRWNTNWNSYLWCGWRATLTSFVDRMRREFKVGRIVGALKYLAVKHSVLPTQARGFFKHLIWWWVSSVIWIELLQTKKVKDRIQHPSSVVWVPRYPSGWKRFGRIYMANSNSCWLPNGWC